MKQKMYSANDLYKMNPERVEKCLGCLKGFYYDHLPEIEGDLWGLENKNDKVEIKVLKDFDFDGRRLWRLSTVWFDGKPTMIIQNAGREGDDHRERFITDVKEFKNMISYINSLIEEDTCDDVCFTNPDDKIKCLTSFYGNELFGVFERY
jgi:hypothetical protein